MPITVRIVLDHRLPIPSEENHRRGAVARNIRPAGVDDVRQVDTREELLDQLLAELALHEAVGRDLPREAALHRERDDSFQERHGQRILHVTGRISFPIRLLQCRILGRDVRRIRDHRVIGPGPKQSSQGFGIFGLINMLESSAPSNIC